MNVAEYLDALGISEDEMVGMLWIRGDAKHTAVMPRDSVQAIADYQIPNEFNAYISPNPTSGPARVDKGRGTEEQVTRLATIFADLDVKPGACQSIDAAHQLVDEISARIAERPTIVTFSGGGLQPIWVLQECSPEVGRPLLRRFGRLVKAVGQERGIKLDSVFDAARVLRIPGSLNHKYGDPIECSAIPDTGGPIEPATLAERLDEWGISEADGDDKVGLGEVVEAETGWRYAMEACGYSVTTISGWLSEPVTERHPWLLNTLVRLECMRRNGCLTREQYSVTLHQLEAKFHRLLSSQEPRRTAKRYEVKDVHNVAIDRAARKAAGKDLDTEIGGAAGHVHLTGGVPAPVIHLEADTAPEEIPAPAMGALAELEQDFWARESLQNIYGLALSRMCSPWAVLACCVARALATVRPNVALPSLVGGPGSLNWFGAIAAPSGGGKGASMQVARELVTAEVYQRNLGSGEGMVQAFKTSQLVQVYEMGQAVLKASGEPKMKREESSRESVMFVADEIDNMTALGQRSGSTMMGTLRSAFSGETLGFAYATQGKEYHIESHTYRLTLITSIQPGRAAALLDDDAGGTPQRFMWFPGIDDRITAETANSFGGLTEGLITLPTREEWSPYPREIILPPETKQFIIDGRISAMRGETDALDGHALFAREKFAYALAVLDGRVEMTSDDWRLSGIAADVSRATREWVATGLDEHRRREARQRGEVKGVEYAAADEEKADVVQKKSDRVAALALKKIIEAPEGMSERDLKNAFPSRDRAVLTAMLMHLTEQGLVRSEVGPKGGHVWRKA